MGCALSPAPRPVDGHSDHSKSGCDLARTARRLSSGERATALSQAITRVAIDSPGRAWFDTSATLALDQARRRRPRDCRGDAPVAQLDRAPDYESGGREFESLRARQQNQRLRRKSRKQNFSGVPVGFPGDLHRLGPCWLSLFATSDTPSQHGPPPRNKGGGTTHRRPEPDQATM